MNLDLLIFFGSLLAGAFGYFVVTFWCEPILQYHRIRHQVTSDFVFYTNTFQYPIQEAEDAQVIAERRQVNRRHAAELVANYHRLPFFYRTWLKHNEQAPSRAASELMGLSNAVMYEQAEPRIRAIEKALGIGRVL
jgi:hypothetical protein